MKTLDWYFDFISPFAYLQNAVLAPRLVGVVPRATIRRRPILFAGLLGHHGHLGPAEIPPKRTWIYRQCAWIAERNGIPMKMPAMHPFNPLPLLRLSIVLGDSAGAVDRLFAWVWRDGHVPTDGAAWRALLEEVGVDEAALQAPSVKDALRANGEAALAAGVFGVPTAVVDGELFWGFDATEMLLDYLDDGAFFAGAARRAADAVPVGPMRPRRPVPEERR